jgi:F-type H+-transporting ATPase subunit delta
MAAKRSAGENMASPEKHENVLEAGSVRSRLAKVYGEALMAAAQKQNRVNETGDELNGFVTGVFDKNPAIESFLSSPAVGKKAKFAALGAALPGHASDLVRGLFGVLTKNGRLDLVRGIAAAYRQLLDERAGRVRVKVTAAAKLTNAQRDSLAETLSNILKQEPVLDVRVDPDLLGGMVVQVGDRVIDTSVRTRLQTIRTLLLDKGSSYVVKNQG